MSDTIRYRGKVYGEQDAPALMQSLAAMTAEIRVTGYGKTWRASLTDRRDGGLPGEAFAATPWAALCAAVRAAGLEDSTPPGICQEETIAQRGAGDYGKWRRCERQAGHRGKHRTTYNGKKYTWGAADAKP